LPSANANDSSVDPDLAEPVPEIVLNRTLPEPDGFQFATSLLDATSTETAFTIDPAAWRVVAVDGFGTPTQWEYDGDQGDTLRFGDGTFAAQPNDGDAFNVTYRIGMGSAGNLAAGAIQNVDPSASGFLSTVRNPFAVTNGADAETTQHIQRMAPQAFRAVQFRAVIPSDYEAAAETLPWVLNAGTAFRWTGSWLTVFTTVDPQAGQSSGANATLPEQELLIDLLNRRRLAGYESYAPPPTLVSIDLQITVCVKDGWLSSDVEAGVLARVADAKLPDGTAGFFYADRFTFGTPLYRSNLEAAIQGVDGVNGVLDIEYRQRGASNVFQPLPEVLQFGSNQILRLANDPDYPERGTIRVFPEGGR
jgi:predicted phage baseplate assembly protein